MKVNRIPEPVVYYLRAQGWTDVAYSSPDELVFRGTRPCGHEGGFVLSDLEVTRIRSSAELLDRVNQRARCSVCDQTAVDKRVATVLGTLIPDAFVPPRYARSLPLRDGQQDRSVNLARPLTATDVYRLPTPATVLNNFVEMVKVIVRAWASDVVDDTMRFAAVVELDLDNPPRDPVSPFYGIDRSVGPGWTREYLGVPTREERNEPPEWHNQLEMD